MASVKLNPPVPAEPEFILTLTLEEALTVHSLTGRTTPFTLKGDESERAILSIYSALDNHRAALRPVNAR